MAALRESKRLTDEILEPRCLRSNNHHSSYWCPLGGLRSGRMMCAAGAPEISQCAAHPHSLYRRCWRCLLRKVPLAQLVLHLFQRQWVLHDMQCMITVTFLESVRDARRDEIETVILACCHETWFVA